MQFRQQWPCHIDNCNMAATCAPSAVAIHPDSVLYLQIYAEVLADCTTEGSGALGCASAETFTAAYAEACASAVAEAWADANIEEECGCQNAISDSSYASADAHATLFAEVEAWALADTGCISGDQTVTKNIYVGCAADAFAVLLSKVAPPHMLVPVAQSELITTAMLSLIRQGFDCCRSSGLSDHNSLSSHHWLAGCTGSCRGACEGTVHAGRTGILSVLPGRWNL